MCVRERDLLREEDAERLVVIFFLDFDEKLISFGSFFLRQQIQKNDEQIRRVRVIR